MNDDKDKKEEQEKGMPIIVIKDSESKMKLARVVPKKGVDPYAVDRIKKDIDQLGYKTIIFKSDQENSIKALKQAIKDASNVEIRMEESPVGEHQANGSIENAIRDIKSQFRTLKDALDTRYQNKYSGEHPSITWMFKHAADIINRTRIGIDGKTAFRRLRGNNFVQKVAEFGENVWYLRQNSLGKDKFNSRWSEGIYLGAINESSETIIGTDQGVVKSRDFRRKSIYADRWNKDRFDSIKGTPWEPSPGRGGDYQIKSRIFLPDTGPISDPARGRERDNIKGNISRIFNIFKTDLIKYGYQQ